MVEESRTTNTMNPFTNGKLVGKTLPAEYHKPNCARGNPYFIMSRGELFTFSKNPLKWKLGAEDESTKATEWGDLMDCLVTCPDSFDKRFVIRPETYFAPPKKNGEPNIEKPWTRKADACSEWEDGYIALGKAVVSPDDFHAADKAVKFLRTDPELNAILENSECQLMATADYTDKATGLIISVKVLPDIVPSQHKALIDFKTGRSAEPNHHIDEIFKRGLHWQAAIYLDVWEAATGEDRPEFLHIVQESEPPYIFEKIAMTQEYIDLGRSGYRAALAKYCQCLERNQWPSYPISPEHQMLNGWRYVGPKPWMTTANAESSPFVQAPQPEKSEEYAEGITP